MPSLTDALFAGGDTPQLVYGIVQTTSPLTVTVAPSTVAVSCIGLNGQSFVVGQKVAIVQQGADRLMIGAVNNGIFSTFNPTIDQGASANIAHTLDFSEWKYDGVYVTWDVTASITGPGTAGSEVRIDLPVTPLVPTFKVIGVGKVFDASAAVSYVGAAQYLGGQCYVQTSGVGGGVGSTPSFALASGDAIDLHVRYRAI